MWTLQQINNSDNNHPSTWTLETCSAPTLLSRAAFDKETEGVPNEWAAFDIVEFRLTRRSKHAVLSRIWMGLLKLSWY